MTAAAEAEVPRRAWVVLLLACMAGFAGALDLSVVFVAFPAIEDAFPDASTALLSWVLTIYGIVIAALLVPGGRLADLFGRRKVFLTGVVIFGLGALASGAAPDPGVLIATRAFQACGGALMTPAAMALVLREFPVDRRAMAIGTWGAVGGVAAACGPSLGALVVDLGGWRWGFWLSVPIAVIVFVWGRVVLVESVDPNVHGLTDLVGSFLVMVAVGSLALAIVEGPSWGWTSAAVLGALAVSAISAVVLVRRSSRHPDPVIAPDLFAAPLFRRANVVALLFGAAFFAMFFGLVRFLTEGWGYSTGHAGLLVTPGPAAAAVFSYIGGNLADRFGHRAVMVPGALIFAVGGGVAGPRHRRGARHLDRVGAGRPLARGRHRPGLPELPERGGARRPRGPLRRGRRGHPDGGPPLGHHRHRPGRRAGRQRGRRRPRGRLRPVVVDPGRARPPVRRRQPRHRHPLTRVPPS